MITDDLPLITCVMVTEGRWPLMKKSIDCYLNQSYMNKNLVILSQGSSEINFSIEDYVSKHNDITFLSVPKRLSLGALRNLSVEIATGDIICQWDDDDLYHPHRIITQYKNLSMNENNSASIYCDFLKYFKLKKTIYWCDWSGEPPLINKFLCGSVMFWKRFFYDFMPFYPEKGNQSNKEEDLHVLSKLKSKGILCPVFAGHQYIYVYHGDNTYDLKHHKYTLDTSSGKKVYSTNELYEKKDLLIETFKLTNIDTNLFVSSLDECAFIYKENNEV